MAPNVLGNALILADAQIEGLNSEDKEGLIKRHVAAFTVSTEQTEALTSTKKSLGKLPLKTHKFQIVWINVILMAYLHTSALYGAFMLLTQAKFYTWVFSFIYMVYCGLGITAGAHRLWSHRAYKAKWPLRLVLMIAQTAAHQNSIFDWVRDHRVHHKYTDTDADPYNAKRGFFFSHVGWLMVKKHPEVVKKGKLIDLSDILEDPLVRFQKKFFIPLMVFLCFTLPVVIPIYCWGETLSCAWYASIFRYAFGLNGTWLVNSAAHIWGMKPYEKTISPSNNSFVAKMALGEGWHNYHHVFPWDYKTAEMGQYGTNWTTAFIDFFYKLGWAYNLKTVSTEMIKKRVLRTGDGTHEFSKQQQAQTTDLSESFHKYIENFEHKEGEMVWGWDDKDLSLSEKNDAQIIN